jgi:UDP-N-acetylglucosamine transferase subunit ALG13
VSGANGPRVLVTVGTDHHRFDRLIGWVDRWAAAHPDAQVLVQHGTATAPAHGEAVVMLATTSWSTRWRRPTW